MDEPIGDWLCGKEPDDDHTFCNTSAWNGALQLMSMDLVPRTWELRVGDLEVGVLFRIHGDRRPSIRRIRQRL